MSTFNPEISARALIPKDLMGQASSLHLSMHLATDFVEAALAEAAGGEFHWTGIFPIESNQMSGKDALHFVTERNWSDKVFRKCSVSFDTSEICLVPRAFFEPDKAMELIRTIIKNTYRTLMTRGMKGCYVWCADDELADYFKKWL
jgi:hypothetical protein